MATLKKNSNQPATVTLLDKGCEFQGKLSFEGVVRIDGVFRGEIYSQDQLIIGEGARVEAAIQVGKLEVGGEVKGKILARDDLEVHSTGRIFGEIETKILKVDPGALVDASVSMGELRDSSLSSPRPEIIAFGNKA